MILVQFLLVLLLVGSVIGLIVAYSRINEVKAAREKSVADLEAIQLKYKDITDLEAFKDELSQRNDQMRVMLGKYQTDIDLDKLKDSLTNDLGVLQIQIGNARTLNQTLSSQAENIRRELEVYSGEQTVIDCGLYTPVYDFDISQKYKDALLEVREKQKDSLKAETAAICNQTWTINGNVTEGRKQTKHYIRLMLRAFNGESDAIISSVRWNNVDRMIDRLEGAYQAINKLGETHSIKIERDYFQLKLKELRLTYEYQEKLKAEKEEQRRVQEQIREEERAQKEYEKKIRDSEEDERRSRIALEKARQEMQFAQGAEVAKMNGKIQALEAKLAEALANKERGKSQAQMTKFGHVYVISNIGSFGENRFKIGMTRRLEPQDRVDELGDASVPFEFDVHAMIPSDNAPQMEAMLHSRFRNRSVNLVNQRKEFFDVSLGEIESAVHEFNSTIEIIKVPEAKNYRQTLVLRAQLQPQNGTEPVAAQVTQHQVYLFNNGVQEGPFSAETVKEMILSGQADAGATFFWYEGLSGWMPMSQFSG